VPTVAEVFSSALQHHQAGNLRQAELLYQQILQADPNHPDGHHMLGVLAYHRGQFGQAVASIRQALALNPSAAAYYGNLGVAQDALGQTEEAAASYLQALRLQPDYAEAHSNLGNVLRRKGQLEEAVAHYRQALVLRPDSAEVHCNLAVALSDQAKLDDAVAHYRQAVALNPQYAAAHYNLGSALLRQGKFEEAATHCQHTLRLRPDFPEAHNNLANARLGQGRVEEAIRHWREALRLRPDFAEAHYNLANALNSQGNPEEAEGHWRQALRIRPDDPVFHYNLANGLFERDRTDEAVAHYREALRLQADYAEAHCNLGNALESQGRLEEAATHWQQAIRLKPALPEAHNNLGNALLRQGRLEEAVKHCQDALSLNNDLAEAWTTLGNIRQHQCRFDDALGCYEKALSRDANHGETHLNRALLWLLRGNWELGWPEFEWRWQTKSFKRHTFGQPSWDGSPLAGRTLLVLAEQGLGDTMQFIRYVPLLQKLGGRVLVKCQAPLLPLLAESLGWDQLVREGAPLPAFDVYAPLLSLPGILGTRLTSVPADIPYLRAAPGIVERWRQESPKSEVRSPKSEDLQLTSDIGHRTSDFLVGIAWQGCPTYGYDHQRSIPLVHFARLAQVKGVHLISLQKGPGTDQLKQLRLAACGLRLERQEAKPLLESAIRNSQSAILDLGSRLDEASGAFMDSAAIMQNLDLVICSDTAVPHLAGALGIPVWVALAQVPDWRWLLQREDCPWYPTMRLFRQREYGRWEDVFEHMAEELKTVVGCQKTHN